MKFVIDLEDFWIDEEDNLEHALKSHIISDVLRKITNNIESKVEEQISKKVEEVVNERLSSVIDNKLTELIACGMITRHRKEISIVDYIKSEFEGSHGWGSPEKQIERIAKEFGEELKMQYNNAFANNIVQSMREQGFLKDDVAKMLLSPKT